MAIVVGIKFKLGGKIYYFDPKDYEPKLGQHVIVETARGIEYGTVAMERKEVKDDDIVAPLKEVLRLATKDDDERAIQNKLKEKPCLTNIFKECWLEVLNVKFFSIIIFFKCRFALKLQFLFVFYC